MTTKIHLVDQENKRNKSAYLSWREEDFEDVFDVENVRARVRTCNSSTKSSPYIGA